MNVVAVQEEKAMQSVPSSPIDATKFVAYVTERRKKRILFKGEYLVSYSFNLFIFMYITNICNLFNNPMIKPKIYVT